VSSTLNQLRPVARIEYIIETPVTPRQTDPAAFKIIRFQKVVATVKRNVLRGSRNRKLGA